MLTFDPGQKSGCRSADVRFIGPVMGRYLLDSRRGNASAVQVFACRLQCISPKSLVVSAPVLGNPGEEATTHWQPFGILRGRLDRLIDGGFAIEIEADEDERTALAKRIDWYKRRTFQGLDDRREHGRYLPRDPRSKLVLSDGTLIECLIIDMSRSGVAVSADVQLPIGTPLAVGKAVGRVVRWFDVGFGVRFEGELEPEEMEEMLRALSEAA